MYNQLLMAKSALKSIFELLDEQPNVKKIENPHVFNNMRGQIDFNQVQFSYDNERIALHDISLSVKEGETIALVGHTGSGKSSIANLIIRFYDPTKGSVKIDDYDLREVELK